MVLTCPGPRSSPARLFIIDPVIMNEKKHKAKQALCQRIAVTGLFDLFNCICIYTNPQIICL